MAEHTGKTICVGESRPNPVGSVFTGARENLKCLQMLTSLEVCFSRNIATLVRASKVSAKFYYFLFF